MYFAFYLLLFTLYAILLDTLNVNLSRKCIFNSDTITTNTIRKPIKTVSCNCFQVSILSSNVHKLLQAIHNTYNVIKIIVIFLNSPIFDLLNSRKNKKHTNRKTKTIKQTYILKKHTKICLHFNFKGRN